MTEDEKQFLMDLFDKHELSLEVIMCLLGCAAKRMRIVAAETKNESLEQVMYDLDLDCARYLNERS